MYSATVGAQGGATVASAAFALLREDPILQGARAKLAERFGRIAAERLGATSALTAATMSTGIWREHRLALHLSAFIALLALFVVLSNSLDIIRRLALSRMSETTFVTAFYFTMDTALAVVIY